MRVHHFGYIVKDADAALRGFQSLGFELSPGFEPLHIDENRKIIITFVEKDGARIELITPIDATSSFFPLLKRYRNCSYHICYESECIENDTADLINAGWRQITEFDEASAFGGRKVGFFMNPNIGMIELVESTERR